MTQFKDSKVFQILKDRWAGKNMETYFLQKNKEFWKALMKDLNK